MASNRVEQVSLARMHKDDDTWERGKGWVLAGTFGITYCRDTNPTLVADKFRAIEAVLAD